MRKLNLIFNLGLLLQLRSRQLSDVALVLWVVAIIAIPLLGPLAFFVVRPGRGER